MSEAETPLDQVFYHLTVRQRDAAWSDLRRLRSLLSPYAPGIVMCFCQSDPHEPWCSEAREILERST